MCMVFCCGCEIGSENIRSMLEEVESNSIVPVLLSPSLGSYIGCSCPQTMVQGVVIAIRPKNHDQNTIKESRH